VRALGDLTVGDESAATKLDLSTTPDLLKERGKTVRKTEEKEEKEGRRTVQSPPIWVRTLSCVIFVAHSASSRPSVTSSIDLGKSALGTPGAEGTKRSSTTRDPLQVRGDLDAFGPKGTRILFFFKRQLAASEAKVTRAVAS
jgi:hypothetical protein